MHGVEKAVREAVGCDYRAAFRRLGGWGRLGVIPKVPKEGVVCFVRGKNREESDEVRVFANTP